MSRAFRTRFLRGLAQLRDRGALRFGGAITPLAAADSWSALLDAMRAKEWVVYAKPPFGGPRQVLRYLARYTHRIAIGNDRILALDNDHVAFRYKDSAHARRPRTMRLPAVTFLRQFLLHALPSGFMRIQHYGFLANRARKTLLPLAQRLAARDTTPTPESPSTRPVEPVAQRAPRRCPACGESAWLVVAVVAPEPARASSLPLDTS
ncbi:MAG: transposase [bacterium]